MRTNYSLMILILILNVPNASLIVSMGKNNIDEDELQLDDIDFDIERPKRVFDSQHGEEINSLVMKMQNLLMCVKVKNLKQQRIISSFQKWQINFPKEYRIYIIFKKLRHVLSLKTNISIIRTLNLSNSFIGLLED